MLLLMNMTCPSPIRTLAPPGWALAAPIDQAPLIQASFPPFCVAAGPPIGASGSFGVWMVLKAAKP